MKTPPKVKMNIFSYINQSIDDPIGLRAKIFEKYGDIASTNIGGHLSYLVGHPIYAEYILEKHQDKFFNRSPLLYKVFGPFIGPNSLITTSNVEKWFRDRLIAKINFDEKAYFKSYSETIIDFTNKAFQEWEKYPNPKQFNVEEELDKLLVNIVTHTFLVHFDLLNVNEFIKIIPNIVELIKTKLRYVISPLWYFSPSRPKYEAIVKYVKELTYKIIKARIDSGKNWDDTLGFFINEYRFLNEKDLVDYLSQHIATFLVVGYFTTVSLIHWTLVTLSQYPNVRDEIRRELNEKVGSRFPKYEDLPALTYLSAVIKEILRIRPSNYAIMRECVEDDEINGFAFKKGTGIVVSIAHIHRHPEFWENPEGFNPLRFINNPLGQANNYAYIPFGRGKRACIASAFATMEAMMIVAMISQRFQIDLPPHSFVKSYTTTLLTNRPNVKMMWIKPYKGT